MRNEKCYTPKCRRKSFMSLGGRFWFCKDHFIILQAAADLKAQSQHLFKLIGLDAYGQEREQK